MPLETLCFGALFFPPLPRHEALPSVMLLLGVPGHAYINHTAGKKGPLRRTASQKTPQWNFPTSMESITHEKSVCLLLLRGKLELHSVTPFHPNQAQALRRSELTLL